MSFCPKCGNKVDESMAFCPHCGASLKGTPPPVQPYRRNEKAEKKEKNEHREKQEKGERGFVGYLIGGLILITIGLFSVLQLSNALPDTGQNWAIMLLIIGIIIIIGAIYIALTARKHSPVPR
ncbi:MAG: zinc ribbon domain-containing protein [Crenarchaeota archaeon]|jgi:LPXTG-motif cell wall-anchored protein|nr:zinc ribbon domain-containing protein [Thermoproteota archaeon]